MAPPPYEELVPVGRLDELSPDSRTAFALLCATRLLPAYRLYHETTGRGDPTRLEAIADQLWRDLRQPVAKSELEQSLASCMELIPKEDDGWDERTQAYAEDGATALAYAARSRLTGHAQEALWAGRRTFEAIVFLIEKGSDSYLQAGQERAYPLLRAEIERQHSDIAALFAIDLLRDKTAALEQLRESSVAQGREYRLAIP